MERREAVRAPRIRSGEVGGFADDDAVPGVELWLRFTHCRIHVAAAVRRAHERGQALVVARGGKAWIVGEQLASATRVACLDELEDGHDEDY